MARGGERKGIPWGILRRQKSITGPNTSVSIPRARKCAATDSP
jgi:hypothetical protein